MFSSKAKRGVTEKFRTALLALMAAMAVFAHAGGDEAVKLPGEPCTRAPIPCSPFPDRLSAYVWRNWNLVPAERLASVVGATPAALAEVAADMGLGPAGEVLPEWRRKGYITILRRNWHLLGYDQLTKLLDMSRRELAFSLAEDDFLWVKLGRVKPKCEPLVWSPADRSSARRAARRRIAAILAEEKLDPSAPEEPRFAFIKNLATPDREAQDAKREPPTSPFDFRLIFSYFADYGDPLGDPEIRSYPEGLLQRLSRQGVNAVWLHTVLRTLTKDPKYPEWGEGSERRIANLKTLVARAAKYGIRVFLYLNEPRGMDDAFFRADPAREAFRGAPSDDIDICALCPSHPEPLRWLSDSLAQVFSQVPGLGGVFTITMSENMTHCKARGSPKPCARCAKRPVGDIIAAINRATIEGMQRGNPDAEAVLYTWNWPAAEVPSILAKLPKRGCRVMTVSEHGMKFVRGGTPSSVYDYSISVVGPGEHARKFWGEAAEAGFSTVAKVQVANSWELSTFPYLPVDELNARHAANLANAGVKGVMLSWSCGCYPAPNLSVYNELRAGERTPDVLLDRLAASRYGAANVARVRRAWRAFADGFSEYPFHVSVIYRGPHHWGVANPLYPIKTGYAATMVGIPYDDAGGWRGPYPPETFAGQMEKVAKGFAAGCRELEGVAEPRELDLFRAEQLHFESAADQMRFVRARDAGDRTAQLAIARRELARARTYLPWVRADSRIGYESSNHYFFLPRDVIEKALSCRQIIDALAAPAVKVRPAETREALVNPGMGLVAYNMAGRLWAYGSRTASGDALDWFPGVSTVYFRVLWSELEPTEGDYRWDTVDAIAQNWIARGKKLAFRVICCNSTANACPDYVRAAGAKGIWFRYGGHGVAKDFPLRWEPVYDDPVFLAKYEKFLRAFAARYDGNPDVAFVDVGSFGMYGEGHTGGTSKLSKEETDRITRLHLALHRRILPKTLLVISDDVAGSGGQEPEAPLMKYARELGIGYRDDSIFCMGPETNSYAREGSWAHSHWARNFAPETPVVIETGHWTMCREAGRFRPERLLACVERHQASYLSVHAFPEPYLAALKDEMAAVNLRLGYRFALEEVEYPESVRAGERVTIRSRWVNRGVSWLHGGAALTWSLLDASGAVCWSVTDPAFDFRTLDPTLDGRAKPVEVRSSCRFGRTEPIFRLDPVYVSAKAAGLDPGDTYAMLRDGVYTLAVSVGTRAGTPTVALPLENGRGRRYPIGRITVGAAR